MIRGNDQIMLESPTDEHRPRTVNVKIQYSIKWLTSQVFNIKKTIIYQTSFKKVPFLNIYRYLEFFIIYSSFMVGTWEQFIQLSVCTYLVKNNGYLHVWFSNVSTEIYMECLLQYQYVRT